ncbi:hypothetical protein [Ileibacterium valens]|uniref:hypothetical protein n=2 Tax=Ileibacterium valens TaxID=1862668 RepID=UPI00272D1DEF|nr:hypothetical protein [Ileibacterium valens]
MEPVCSQYFPGNMLDLTAYDSFVKDNGITQGILVGDKGFPEKSIEELLKEAPDLHYLNPLRRSAKIAKDYRMYEFDVNANVKPTNNCSEKCANFGWFYFDILLIKGGQNETKSNRPAQPRVEHGKDSRNKTQLYTAGQKV